VIPTGGECLGCVGVAALESVSCGANVHLHTKSFFAVDKGKILIYNHM
jgi:hypothetical protein